jgi:hypothetical protein
MSTRVDSVFGCVLWTGRRDEQGYGRNGLRKAHIVAYESEYGPLPEGFELEHVCRRRACIALHHLEVVTRSENEKRKAWSYRARRAQCAKGHDLKQTAIVTPEGGRVCMTCNREAQRHT